MKWDEILIDLPVGDPSKLEDAYKYISEANLCVALNGLSLAGKSTMTQMLFERTEWDVEIVRENAYDPIREITADLSRLFKKQPDKDSETLMMDLADRKTMPLFETAIEYVRSLDLHSEKNRRQATSAFFYTAGRSFVDRHVRDHMGSGKYNILDRWSMTGCAYQASHDSGESYDWQQIWALNEAFGISVPDIEIILACDPAHVPGRRQYRQKEGIGTAGLESKGREPEIYAKYQEIYEHMRDRPACLWIENFGEPKKNLEMQVTAAIPNYNIIEGVLSDLGWPIMHKPADDHDWFNGESLKRIYERQCRGRVRPADMKEL